MPSTDRKNLLLPFVLTAIVVGLDQLVKAIVVANVPLGATAFSMLDDFFRIWHVRNLGAAFSFGADFGAVLRPLVFSVLPLVLIVVLVVYYFKTKEITRLQRWLIAGIVGGGLGNIIDRIFRPDGVVDFLSFRFFGLFGWDRFPTFNVADSFIVVCGLALLVSAFASESKKVPAASKAS